MSRYQKGKTSLDFTGARDSEWQWHQLGRMQVCISLQTDNHASTPPLSFLQAECPSCSPTNSVKALKPHTPLPPKKDTREIIAAGFSAVRCRPACCHTKDIAARKGTRTFIYSYIVCQLPGRHAIECPLPGATNNNSLCSYNLWLSKGVGRWCNTLAAICGNLCLNNVEE